MSNEAIKKASIETLIKAMKFIVRNSKTETKIINELVNRNVEVESFFME